MGRELKPIKKPIINKAPHARTPNSASPNREITPSGNFLKSDDDHSKWGELSPLEVNHIHARDDVDKSWNAHHHTLGIKSGQASPGNHTHTGYTSKKLGAGAGLTLTGSKAGNVALTNLIAMLKNLIEFTDTTT